MALGALIGVTGLFLFGRHVWNGAAHHSGLPSVTVRSEILTIYAPKAPVVFATAHPEIGTNDELVRLIQDEKLKVWFAIVVRHHQVDGLFADILLSYRPGERPENFEITKAVLVSLAGNPPTSGTEGYTKAHIEVLDDAVMERDVAEESMRLRIR
jgi:hypothetical protein